MDEAWYEGLKRELERRQLVLKEALQVWERSNPETREIRFVLRARELLRVAENRLAEADQLRIRERAREAEAERRRIWAAPPSLQQLVLDHGTYDRITPEAWAKFESDMALWKTRMRAGEFHGDLGLDQPGIESGSGVRGEMDDAGATAGRSGSRRAAS